MVGGKLELAASDVSFFLLCLGQPPHQYISVEVCLGFASAIVDSLPQALQWSAYSRMLLPRKDAAAHAREAVILHSKAYGRPVSTDTTFVSYHNILQSGRKYLAFGRCLFFVEVELAPTTKKLFAMIQQWQVTDSRWVSGRDIEDARFQPLVPLHKEGGRHLVSADLLQTRVVFLQATAQDRGFAAPNGYDRLFRNPA